MTWTACKNFEPGDRIRWKEPVWAAPTKKRGKPDNIGEQLVTAEVASIEDVVVLIVESVEVLVIDDGAEFEGPKMVEGDAIRRKMETILRGECLRDKS